MARCPLCYLCCLHVQETLTTGFVVLPRMQQPVYVGMTLFLFNREVPVYLGKDSGTDFL